MSASGQATFSTSSLKPGTHTITASYTGGTNYGTGTASITINVSAGPQTITFTGLPATATFGAAGPYALNGTASSGLPVSYSVTGPATLSGSTLTIIGAGTVTVTATQSGNSSYGAAKSVTLSIVVGKATTVTTLTAATTNPAAGTTDLLTAKVTGGSPTGSVVFTAGTTTLCTSTINSGVATCSYTASAAGTVPVTANYQGDANSLASAATLILTIKAAPAATISLQFASTQLVYPGATNITACVTSATNITATGTVGIYDGTTLLTTLTLQGNGCGYWYITPGLATGTHSITAKYSGDKSNGAGTSAASPLTVSPAPVNLTASWSSSVFNYGTNYNITVNASTNSTAAPVLGSITYSLDGAAAVPVVLSNGIAGFVITKPGAGNHTLKIAYAQQANYAAASALTETFTVTPAPVSVQLISSASSVKAPASVTFTASVTSANAGAPNASGNVTFTDGSKTLATVTVNASGMATYTTTTLAVGSHTIAAAYAGASNFGTGSASVGVTVK